MVRNWRLKCVVREYEHNQLSGLNQPTGNAISIFQVLIQIHPDKGIERIEKEY